MDNKELTKKELDILNDVPYSFELEYTKEKTIKVKRFFGLFTTNKSIREKVKEVFKIYPLRLSTMDRMAKYQIELYLDNSKFSQNNDSDSFNEMKLVAAKNAYNMANIVAVAVLGVDYSEKEFKCLKKVLFDNLTPIKLEVIANEILNYQSLVNFTNSTVTMSIKTTISPNEVE
ncbi:hypothetical protein [Chishuiella changwenlii]|uniref:hypothetical protein n=1 Tax=Chishuiella changwenlii TaxID=1434701 RepID=UPI002FD9BB90